MLPVLANLSCESTRNCKTKEGGTVKSTFGKKVIESVLDIYAGSETRFANQICSFTF
jgi:hypothetical protein